MIPWLYLIQLNIPTKYDLSGISVGDIKQAMSNLADKATVFINNALSAAGHAVENAVGSVLSIAMHVIGLTKHP
jgi:hypothetical protein